MKKKFIWTLLPLVLLMSCKTTYKGPSKVINIGEFLGTETFNAKLPNPGKYQYQQELNIIDDNYRNYYEIFVGSYHDSDGDGMGDLKGVVEKLDYLADLGVSGIWLMPISPSPSYHKYDVTNYCDIDKAYGSLDDFDLLIAEANLRGIKVIIDLVINHSSSAHPWFSTAENALRKGDTNNKYINYYNFSRTKSEKYHQSGASGWYYEGWFSSNMPDLNMDNPEVRQEFENIAKFWIDRGVQGFRIDAAMHVFTGNHAKNIEFFRWFMDYCKTIKEDVYMVAEVWDSTNTVIDYYNSSLPSVFNYPFSQADGPIARTVVAKYYSGETFVSRLAEFKGMMNAINPDAIDAMFLSNHDNPRSGNAYWRNIYAIKFAASIYLMAPGNPFIYYGEEIGMLSAGKLDENYRGPMYWDKDSMTNPPVGMEEPVYYFPTAKVQTSQNNSIHATYKRALRIRNENPEIARGVITPLTTSNESLGAYRSTYQDSSVVIIHNFSYSPLKINITDLGFTYQEIRGFLSATSEDFLISDQSITFPAFSTLIVK